MPDSGRVISITVVLPSRLLSELTTPHPWSTCVDQHEGWRGVHADEMRAATVANVRRLATHWETAQMSLADDPWLDDELADRFTERLRWVTESLLNRKELGLSAAELALLIAFPYLHQAFWAWRAAEALQGTNPASLAFTSLGEGTSFHEFAEKDGALHRRGTRAFGADDPSAHSIAWWLFHQWLVAQPDCFNTANVTAMLPREIQTPLNAVFAPTRLMELLRVVQFGPAFLRTPGREQALRPVARVAGGTTKEQKVREQLLGYLLIFAHRTTIDPALLPRVIADHIGIDDGVSTSEVLHAIKKASWDGGRTRVLTTEWSHPATALMLRRQAAGVDMVLAEIAGASEDTPKLKPLQKLPVHASSEGIESEGHQFTLADDRIQELLMGEQLYGTPELAIRELYQNALDACRYREARTAYLEKPGPVAWRGRISFRQDVDERGRPYLECEDNGIGMGDRELLDVFSRAGIRFADLPEYVEERADWATKGIESYPNSRFGIGVLSYFMLADEITVTTCRLSRDGKPESRLEVHIAGPGALFRVRDLGIGEDAGTVVRLWLRPIANPVRCTDLLRRILWISDYEVISDGPSGRQAWEPCRLSTIAPIGSDALDADADRIARRLVPADGGKVWWCDTSGAVLADGIWAGTSVFGAVVNLSGRDLPRLTIDRKTIIGLDRSLVAELLHAAIPALLDNPDSPLSHSWLSALVDDMPVLADEICERAIAKRHRPWVVANEKMAIEIVGCFPDDARALTSDGGSSPGWDDRTGAWRLAAWLRASEQPSPLEVRGAVTPARPSDKILLKTHEKYPQWLSDYVRPVLGHILSAALRMNRSPADLASRLTVLGYAVPDPGDLPTDVRPTDPVLLSEKRTGQPPWLSEKLPVSHGHVLLAALVTGLAPDAVARRLGGFGYAVPTAERLPAVVQASDTALLQGALSDRTSSGNDVVGLAHVMVIASATERTPAEVTQRLSELGYRVPDSAALPSSHHIDDKTVLAKHVNPHLPRRAQLIRITTAAMESDRTVAQVAARFVEAGLEVPADDELPELIRPQDDLLTRIQDLTDPNYGFRHPVPAIGLGHVLCAAHRSEKTPTWVARRLTSLGYEPPPFETLPDEVGFEDLLLLSGAIGEESGVGSTVGRDRWLRDGQQVNPQRILIVAAKTGRPPRELARRLAELGFEVPSSAALDLDVRDDDLRLLSVGLDRRPPWLEGDHPALLRTGLTLPLGHVLAAATLLDSPAVEVAARLEELGLRVEGADIPTKVDPLARQLLNRATDLQMWSLRNRDELPWLSATTPVGVQHLLITSARTSLPPDEIARRLTALGFSVEDSRNLPAVVDDRDLRLMSAHGANREPFLPLGTEFPRGRIPSAAVSTEMSHRWVIDRLQRLGYTIGS